MSRKIILFLAVIFLFSVSHAARAEMVINEIMYDPSGTDTNREWVEVYNSGGSAVDLSQWFFFSDNTKHSLTPKTSSSLATGEYAVIVQDSVKFAIDWPNFSGL